MRYVGIKWCDISIDQIAFSGRGRRDSGSRICLMDTSLYINKIEKHLVDAATYKELDTDPTHAIRNAVLSTLDYLHITHGRDDETRDHLTPPNLASVPVFSGLPKVHIPNITIWPIVSACYSPTNQLLNYITHFIQPLVETLSSFTQDSKRFFSSLSPSDPYMRMPSWSILMSHHFTPTYHMKSA